MTTTTGKAPSECDGTEFLENVKWKKKLKTFWEIKYVVKRPFVIVLIHDIS